MLVYFTCVYVCVCACCLINGKFAACRNIRNIRLEYSVDQKIELTNLPDKVRSLSSFQYF